MALFSPWGNSQVLDNNGAPAVGWRIETFVANSSTPLATFVDAAESASQTNPVILNALGFPTNGQIFLTSGIAYKLVLSNAAGVVQKTADFIFGVTSAASAINQFQASGVTPTFISTTSFTLAGDQTTNFHVGRRVQFTVTAGQVYGTIAVSAFGALTTVTMTMDGAQVLDVGLSAVNLSILTAIDVALPNSAAARLALGIPVSIVTIPTPSLAANAMTIPARSFTLDYRSATLTSAVISTVTGTHAALVVPAGATLGQVSAVQSDVILLSLNSAVPPEYAVVNAAGGVDLSETGVISTTAISAGATSASVVYSTTARTAVAYRNLGLYRSTQTTAGNWAQALTLLQGVGGQVRLASASLVRLNTANGYGSTNTQIRRFSTVVSNVGTDITYADSASLGATFTINVSGNYAIGYTDQFTAQAAVGLSLNSTQLTTSIYSITVADILSAIISVSANIAAFAGFSGFLAAGSVIRPHCNAAATGANTQFCQFNIARMD